MKQEPVAWINRKGEFMPEKVDSFDIPLYTEPQYRELSDEEILAITKDSAIFEYREFDDDMIRFARAILKKASEK